MPNKQLLHLVFGGQLVRPDSTEFVDPSKLHIVGIFPSYAEAYQAWRRSGAGENSTCFDPWLTINQYARVLRIRLTSPG